MGKTIKETDSSVMEEVGEVELQVSRGSLIGDRPKTQLTLQPAHHACMANGDLIQILISFTDADV